MHFYMGLLSKADDCTSMTFGYTTYWINERPIILKENHSQLTIDVS
jgi:hypothetical protein